MAQLKQLNRDEFAFYINTKPEAEEFTIEGIGVNSLAISYNPQVSQEKNILSRNADPVFDGYQMQSSVSDKRIYQGDPLWDFLNEARRHAKAIETTGLEIEMASGTGEPSPKYKATKFNILIVITEFLGEKAVLGYDIYFKGDPMPGTATIAEKKPTFAPEVIA